MTAFTIGMIAAGLWVVLIILIWVLGRSSPKHPFLSIGHFRRARKTLSDSIERSESDKPEDEEDSDEPLLSFLLEQQPENASPWPEAPLEQEAANWPQPEFTGELSEPGEFNPAQPGSEEEEITSVLEAITSEASPRKKVLSAPKARPPAKRGPRRSGRITYVVVDDQGRPEI